MKRLKKRRTLMTKSRLNNVRSYWIGVGLSASRDNRLDLLEKSKYKKSIQAGYIADNRRDVSKKFI